MKNFAYGFIVLGFAFVGCMSPGQEEVAAAIQIQPSNVSITEGDTAKISVTATGSNLAYRWIKNDSDTLTGDTLPTLTLPNVQFSEDSTTYKCRVSNGAGSVVSLPARLRVALLSIPSSVRMTYSTNLIIPPVTDTSAASKLSGATFSGYIGDSQTVYFNTGRDTMWFIYQNYENQYKLAQYMFPGDFRLGTDSLGVHEITGQVTAYYNDGITLSEKTKYSMGNKVPLKNRLPKGKYKVYIRVSISCFCIPTPPAQYFYAEFNVGNP